MAKIRKNQFWRCLKFPKRSIKILRRYKTTPQDRHLIDGWFVQGYEKDMSVGSEYKISETSIKQNWVKRDLMYYVRKLLKFRLRFEVYYK